jgi:hypothetical protein
MKHFAVALALGALAGPVAADPVEATRKGVERAASATARGVQAVEGAVKKGLKKAAQGVQTGLRAANKGVDKVGAKAKLPPGDAQATERLKDGAEKR